MVDSKPNAVLPKLAPITEEIPRFDAYLPWGPFFGVFVKKGTPEDAVARLRAAYGEGVKNPDFQALMDQRGFVVMNISGDEARAFLDKRRSGTSLIVYDAGIAKTSPEEFGILRP